MSLPPRLGFASAAVALRAFAEGAVPGRLDSGPLATSSRAGIVVFAIDVCNVRARMDRQMDANRATTDGIGWSCDADAGGGPWGCSSYDIVEIDCSASNLPFP